MYAGADPGFVGPEAYTIFRALFRKKEYKITNESEYLFRALPSVSVQVRGPADLASFASR